MGQRLIAGVVGNLQRCVEKEGRGEEGERKKKKKTRRRRKKKKIKLFVVVDGVVDSVVDGVVVVVGEQVIARVIVQVMARVMVQVPSNGRNSSRSVDGMYIHSTVLYVVCGRRRCSGSAPQNEGTVPCVKKGQPRAIACSETGAGCHAYF